MKVSQAEWEAKGRELFGEDKCNWRFVCPKCGDECSLNEVKERYPEGTTVMYRKVDRIVLGLEFPKDFVAIRNEDVIGEVVRDFELEGTE